MSVVRSLFTLATSGLFAVTVASPAASQSMDTIRVGSVRLARMPIGADTFDIDLEMPSPAGVQHQKNVSTTRTTLELLGRDSVLHVHFGGAGAKPYWDVFLSPRTLATIQYEQHTEIDSLVVTRRGDCLTGWVDMQNAARRNVVCDKYTDRFAGSPLDERLIPLLPLRAGMNVSLATYAPVFGKPGDYAISVAGLDTLSMRGKSYRAWRVEHRVTSEYGAFVTTMWVDQDQPRVLKFVRTFGNGRKVTSLLRNP